MTIINAYCDGSISDAAMIDPFQSWRSGEHVARLIVLVPTCDLGMIKQIRTGILTPDGNPDSVFVESCAIREAIEFCTNLEVEEFVVYSDCEQAIRSVDDSRVRWAPRKAVYQPNAFFDRLLRRAAYLRQTEKKVKNRQPPASHQLEIFELFQTEYQEFRLSQSPLWARILKDEKRYRRVQP